MIKTIYDVVCFYVPLWQYYDTYFSACVFLSNCFLEWHRITHSQNGFTTISFLLPLSCQKLLYIQCVYANFHGFSQIKNLGVSEFCNGNRNFGTMKVIS